MNKKESDWSVRKGWERQYREVGLRERLGGRECRRRLRQGRIEETKRKE